MEEFNPRSLEPFWDAWYIEGLIGEGSFGTVYKIHREEFGTRHYCALKIISVPKSKAEEQQVFYEGMDENSATQYFREIVEVIYKEISIMAELKGKTNIVSYEDHKIIKKPQGVGYLILIRMELLESLNDYLLHTNFDIQKIIGLGKDMCRALILCQKRNLIHRDIKPANIFVSSDGDFKLGDFGIARQLEGAQDGLSIKGSYAYMAPEVYSGNNYDERVDIYSLGMVLYYFLNNKKGPFASDATVQSYSERQECLRRRFGGEKLPKPVLGSEKVVQVILKACEYDPKDRYSSPEEFLLALTSLSEEDMSPGSISISGEKSIDKKVNPKEIPDDSEQTMVLPVAEDTEATVYMNTDQDLDGTVYMEDPDKNIVARTGKKKWSAGKLLIPVLLGICLLIGGYVLLQQFNKDKAAETGAEPMDEEEKRNELNDKKDAVDKKDEAGSAEASWDTKEQGQADDTKPTEMATEGQDTITESVEKREELLADMGLENLSSISHPETVTSLNASRNRLITLEELRNSIWMENLSININQIMDLSPLSEMKQLISLDASDNRIMDLGPLQELKSLEILILSNNNIQRLEPLKELDALTTLYLDGNTAIEDISALSSLNNLEALILSGTAVKDISPLFLLDSLKILDVTNTKVPEEQYKKWEMEYRNGQ